MIQFRISYLPRRLTLICVCVCVCDSKQFSDICAFFIKLHQDTEVKSTTTSIKTPLYYFIKASVIFLFFAPYLISFFLHLCNLITLWILGKWHKTTCNLLRLDLSTQLKCCVYQLCVPSCCWIVQHRDEAFTDWGSWSSRLAYIVYKVAMSIWARLSTWLSISFLYDKKMQLVNPSTNPL